MRPRAGSEINDCREFALTMTLESQRLRVRRLKFFHRLWKHEHITEAAYSSSYRCRVRSERIGSTLESATRSSNSITEDVSSKSDPRNHSLLTKMAWETPPGRFTFPSGRVQTPKLRCGSCAGRKATIKIWRLAHQ